jgi:hypothetical protein
MIPSLQSSWLQLSANLFGFLPLLAGAAIIFLLGLLISDWIKKLTEEFLKIARIPKLTQQLGVDATLKQADITQTPVQILGQVTKWITVLVFVNASSNLLGLDAISQIINRFILFLPNLLVALLILTTGLILANFTESLSKGLLANFDKHIQRPLARFTRYLVVVFFTLAAISQLNIAQPLITTFFQGLTATLTLAIGLSVGLGSKDLVKKILESWYQNLQKPPSKAKKSSS